MINPIGVKTLNQSYQDEQAQPETALDSGIFGAAWKAGTYFDEINEWYQEKEQAFKDEPDWGVSEQMATKLAKDFNPQEHEYIAKATSKREYDWRLTNVGRHRKDAKELAKYGNYGTAMTLAAGFLDPVGWAAGAATGGVGKIAQLGSTAGRFALSATAGAAAGYGMGKFEQQYNTTVTDEDIILNAALGAGLEGMIGAFVGRPKTKVINEQFVDEGGKVLTKMKGGEVKAAKRTNVENYMAHLESTLPKSPDVDHIKVRVKDSDNVIVANREAAADAWVKDLKSTKASDSRVAVSFFKKAEQIHGKYVAKIAKLDIKTPEGKKAKAKLNSELASSLKKLKGKTRLTAISDKKLNPYLKEHQKGFDTLQGYKKDLEKASTVPTLVDFDSLDDAGKAAKAQEWKSTGAARVGDIKKNLDHEILPEGQGLDTQKEFSEDFKMESGNVNIGQNFASDMLQSIHTTLSTSKSPVFRGMNNLLFPNPQGAKKGGYVSSETASVTAFAAKNMIRTAGGGAMTRKESFKAFLKDRDTNIVKGILSQKLQKEFNRDIALGLDSSEYYSHLPKYMQEAVDSYAAQYKKALELQQEAGVRGFEGIKYNKHYVPKILSAASMVQAAAKYGKPAVLTVMSKAYQLGGFKLKPKTADALAEIQYSRLMGNVARGESVVPKSINKDQLTTELKQAGMKDDEIAAFFDARETLDHKELMSARAKRSVRPALDAKVGELSYFDLINNNMEEVMETYSREASGNVGMASSMGIGSYRSAHKVVDEELAKAINANPKEADRLQTEAQILRDGVDLIYGRNLETENATLVKNLSRLKQLTRILMLPMNGLTSMPELARPLFMNGITATLKSMPCLTRKAMKKNNREDFLEIDEVFAHAGEDFMFDPWQLDLEEFADMSMGGERWADKLPAGLMPAIDRALAAGGELSSMLSGQRLIQGTGEKLAVRAIIHNIKKGKLSEQRARDAGWIQNRRKFVEAPAKPEGGEELAKWKAEWPEDKEVNGQWVQGRSEMGEVNFLDEVIEHMKSSGKKSEDGKYDLLDVQGMDPQMIRRLQTGVHLLVARDMQRMFVGELPVSMNKWFGSWLTQFKSFPFASISKQLVHDTRGGDKMSSMGVLLGGIGLAYASNYAKAYMNYHGDEDIRNRQSFDRYLDSRLNGSAGAYNVMMGTGQLSGLGIMADPLAALNLLPEDLLASKENGWAGASGSFVPPSVGVIENFGKAAKGDLKAIENSIPFAKTMGLNQALSYITE